MASFSSRSIDPTTPSYGLSPQTSVLDSLCSDRNASARPQVDPALGRVGAYSLRQAMSSVVKLSSLSLLTSVRDVSQQMVSVFRSMTAVGWLVAQATHNAVVDFDGVGEYLARGTLYDPTGEVLCEDRYRTDFNLQPRDGVAIADWQPGIFFLGLCINEVAQEFLHLANVVLKRAQFDQRLEYLFPKPAADQPRQVTDVIHPRYAQMCWFLAKCIRNLSLALKQGGLIAMGIAMSAELFREGVPTMPFYGMNDLLLAEPSDQNIVIQRRFPCEPVNTEYQTAVGAEYIIRGVLSLPAFVTAKVEAKQLIDILFKAGIGAVLLGNFLSGANEILQLQVIRHKIQSHQPQGQTPNQWHQARLDWALHTVQQQGLLPKALQTYAAHRLAQHFEPPNAATVTPAQPGLISLMSELRKGTNRLGNVLMITAYVSRLVTKGVPFISSGFNGLAAGETLRFPFEVYEDIRGYQLNAVGEMSIPRSRLDGITTQVFVPLLVSGFALRYFGTVMNVLHQQVKQLATLKASQQIESSECFYNERQLLQKMFLQRPGYYGLTTAALALADLTTGLMNAVGLFGVSLVIGSTLASEFVGGSQIRADGVVTGNFEVQQNLIFYNQTLASQTDQVPPFTETIETIEVPNPSQITKTTMVVGAGIGVSLLTLSRLVDYLVHYYADAGMTSQLLSDLSSFSSTPRVEAELTARPHDTPDGISGFEEMV